MASFSQLFDLSLLGGCGNLVVNSCGTVGSVCTSSTRRPSVTMVINDTWVSRHLSSPSAVSCEVMEGKATIWPLCRHDLFLENMSIFAKTVFLDYISEQFVNLTKRKQQANYATSKRQKCICTFARKSAEYFRVGRASVCMNLYLHQIDTVLSSWGEHGSFLMKLWWSLNPLNLLETQNSV